MQKTPCPWSAIALLALALLISCSQSEEEAFDSSSVETITRKSGDRTLIPSPKKVPAPFILPWREQANASVPTITKEYFRCKGSSLNPEKTVERQGRIVQIRDCSGRDCHGLPLHQHQEFIYPILIELLNHIQARTGATVVITSGHRCPDHNDYVDPSPPNTTSKHLIGAEVSFFVQGMEQHPEKIIDLILAYYREISPFREDPEFFLFKRYEKEDTNVAIKPWYNKEIFIKLFQATEGRNFDNRHPFPYVSLQVRYDTDNKKKVAYTWEHAHQNYLRK